MQPPYLSPSLAVMVITAPVKTTFQSDVVPFKRTLQWTMVTRRTTWRLLQIANGQHCFHCFPFVQISRCWAIPVSIPTRSGSRKLPTVAFRGFFHVVILHICPFGGFRPVTLLPLACTPSLRLWLCVFLVCFCSANLETSGRPWDGKKPSCGQTYHTRNMSSGRKAFSKQNQKMSCFWKESKVSM